jgi:hypothetical protein
VPRRKGGFWSLWGVRRWPSNSADFLGFSAFWSRGVDREIDLWAVCFAL